MSGRSQHLKQAGAVDAGGAERAEPGGAEPGDAERAEPGSASETRRTQQRQAIFHELAHGDRALSAQELHERLRAADAGVGLATVYRNLGRLAEEGAIDAIRRPSGETAYRACGAGHHHHLTCRTCGAVVELHDCTIADWSRRIAAEHGFERVEHQAELSGICANCR